MSNQPTNSIEAPKKRNKFLKNGKDFLQRNSLARKAYEHKKLVSGLVLTILLAPVVDKTLTDYLQTANAEELTQMDRAATRKIKNIKKSRAITELEKKIKGYDETIKILREGVNYSHKKLGEKGITSTEAQDIREKILNPSKELLPAVRQERSAAMRELSKLENS